MVRNYINGLLVDQDILPFAKEAIGPTKPHRGRDVTGRLHRPRLCGLATLFFETEGRPACFQKGPCQVG